MRVAGLLASCCAQVAAAREALHGLGAARKLLPVDTPVDDPNRSFQSTFTVLTCLGEALYGEILLVRHRHGTKHSDDPTCLRAVKKVRALPIMQACVLRCVEV